MSRRILLADDSVTIQKVIELTFMDEDFEVTAVSNGDEAVALLPQLQPDFVIADVHMPGANGYEVCRRSKAAKPHVPVLLLVGTFEPFDEGQARSAGSDAFLKKPFDSQELLHLVQQLLDQPAGAASPAPPPSPQPVATPAPSPFPAAAPTAPTPVSAFQASPPLPLLHTEPEPADEPAWSNFELEAEPEPAPFPAAPAATAGFAWAPEVASPAEEAIFELEPADDLSLSLDEELLPGESPFAYEPPLPPGFEAAGFGSAELEEVPAPWQTTPQAFAATPDERAGVPLGAAPLVDSLAEVEHRIDEHAAEHEPLSELPDWAAEPFAAPAPTPPTPPVMAPAAGLGGFGVGAVSLPAAPAGSLSDADVDRIARRLVELLGDKVVRDVAWEVVPDLAEVVIKDRLRELESQAE